VPDDSTAGDAYVEHVSKLLDAEYERRKVLEARGDSIIKTSAAVIALIFALTVLISGKDYKFTNHWFSIWFLTAALVFFVASAAIAIYVQNWGMKYKMTARETLEAMTQSLWDMDPANAKRMCLQRLINTTLSMRDGNAKKAAAAQCSVILQVAAILLLSLSLVFELTGKPPESAKPAPPPGCNCCTPCTPISSVVPSK
jgi:hypothetical protein